MWELVRGLDYWLLAKIDDQDLPVFTVGPCSIPDDEAQNMAFNLVRSNEYEEELTEIVITRKGKNLWHVTDYDSSTQTDSFLGCLEWATGALSPGGPGVIFKWAKGWTDD